MGTQSIIFVFALLLTLPAYAEQEATGCLRDYEADGSPSPCLLQYREIKKECPASGSCFDPKLAGAWIHAPTKGKTYRADQLPFVTGWVIQPDSKVFPLAIDFDTGRLATGGEDLSFVNVGYGCQGEFYRTTWFVGRLAMHCGRYRFKRKNLEISLTKSDPYTEYVPVSLGDKVSEPIPFTFNATLNQKRIDVPRVGRTVPAYAKLLMTGRQSKLIIYVDSGIYQIRIAKPDGLTAGRHSEESAGSVYIEQRVSDHVSKEYRHYHDQAIPNFIEIHRIDSEQGRVAGRFNYAMRATRDDTTRLEGTFDIPMYKFERTGKPSGQ